MAEEHIDAFMFERSYRCKQIVEISFKHRFCSVLETIEKMMLLSNFAAAF